MFGRVNVIGEMETPVGAGIEEWDQALRTVVAEFVSALGRREAKTQCFVRQRRGFA